MSDGEVRCLFEIARRIKKYHGKAVIIRIDTNGHGYLLNERRDVVEELKAAGIDKITVSLNAHDEEAYNHVCRPTFKDAYERVQEFISKSKEVFDAEVTAIAVLEIDTQKMGDNAQKMGAKFRIRQHIPRFL